MQIVAVGIDAGLVHAFFLVVFLDKEPAALGTCRIRGLVKSHEIALRIIRAAVEFLASAFGRDPRNNVAAAFRAFCERHGLCKCTFRKS